MPSLASRPMFTALIIACALFMENLDGTIVTTALPDMAVSFGTSPLKLSLGITAYMLSLAVFIPISGWVADRFGSRTVFRAAIGVFTLGSIICGLSQSVGEFTAARVLQGIGGAMMVPVGRLVLLRSVEKSELVRALAYLTVPALIGPVLGPPVGGFITTYASWHWIFFINVPIGLLGMVLVSRYFENHREPETPPLDWLGFALTGLALTSLMYGFELLGRDPSEQTTIAGFIGVGAVVGVFAVRHARTHRHALIDLSLLRIPTFAMTITGGSLFRIAGGAFPFLLPLMFQIGFGMNAFTSGMLTFAGAAGSLLMKMTTRPILVRFGFRTALIGNGILSAGFIAVCCWFTDTTPALVVSALLLAGGFFRSLQFTSLNALAFADVPPRQMSAATSLSSMAQQISLGFGVALAAGLLHATVSLRAAPALSATDFRIVLGIVGALALVSILPFMRLPVDAGAEMTGCRQRSSAIAEPVPTGGDD
ncbi:MAG TPA: MFS transporter [Stellaceae bacterium]|nr:MFS transporter [Stellaceae bacterium]